MTKDPIYHYMKKEELIFKIISDGKVIASFLKESDRDLCLDLLQSTYEDCIFESSDGE